MSNSVDNIHNKVKKASKWSIFMNLVTQLVPPVVTMILARILNPEDFGIASIATIVISFSAIFVDAGFQKYVIQKHLTDDEIKSGELDRVATVAFWTNLALSLIIWCIIFIFSRHIAISFGSPE